MAGELRSVLLTPNLLGADGVSSLSREIIRALPRPAVVLSLHDGSTRAGNSEDVEMCGAEGGRARFLAMASGISLRCSPATEIVCSHLHLAPAAALLAWKGGRVTAVLCGIEAWVPLRKTEAWALDRAALVAISHHTVAGSRGANLLCFEMSLSVIRAARPGGRPRWCLLSRPVARNDCGAHVADERYKGTTSC